MTTPAQRRAYRAVLLLVADCHPADLGALKLYPTTVRRLARAVPDAGPPADPVPAAPADPQGIRP